MTESSGRLAGKMKWLVARYPKPPGDMIRLGSILKDPEEPESSLNLETEEGIKPVPNKRDDSVAVRATITSELSTNLSALIEAKIPGNPIIDAAIELEADKSKSAETAVEAMNVRAEIFLPSDDYMEKALANPKVTKYVKEGRFAFSKSVYIIVGVATAEKLNVKEKLAKKVSASASGGVSTVGDAAKTRGKLSGGQAASTEIEREVDVDCDFAYRVREIIYSKQPFKEGKWSEGKDYTEAAMFRDGGDDRKEKDVAVEEIPKFDELMDEDEAPVGMLTFFT